LSATLTLPGLGKGSPSFLERGFERYSPQISSHEMMLL
jgi:hypothetical protein